MISIWQCYLHGMAMLCAMVGKWHGNDMATVWQRYGNGTAMAWQWYDNCMAMLCTDGTIIAVFAIRKLGRFPRNQFTNRRRSVYLFCFIIVFSSISLVTPAVEGRWYGITILKWKLVDIWCFWGGWVDWWVERTNCLLIFPQSIHKLFANVSMRPAVKDNNYCLQENTT